MAELLATLGNAIYSWWLHPIAVHDGSRLWVGSVNAGTPGVLDQRNRLWRVDGDDVDSVLLDGETSPDDHNGVAVAFNPDQSRLIVFYARHNNDNFTRYQFVNRNTLALDPLQTLDFGGDVTYNQVLQNGDTIHLVVRNATDEQWQYRTSTDWGSTWGDIKTLLDFSGFGSTYVVCRPDPDDPTVYRMAVGPHPPNTTHNETHYARIDLGSGNISRAGGTVVGNLDATSGPGLLPTDLDTVVEPQGTERTRLLDVGTVDGQPAVAYAIWEGVSPPPPAEYRVRRWSGSSWSDVGWSEESGVEFGYLASRQYLGGVVLGRGDDLFSAREDAGTWIVEHWTWDGTGFELDQEIDRSSTRLIRPYVPQGAGPADLVYQRTTQYADDATNDYFADLLVVSLDEAEEEPSPPSTPPIARAAVRTRVTWYGCDAVTGAIIAELSELRGEISRVLGAYTSSALELPIPLAGPGKLPLGLALQATEPGRTMIVSVINDLPAWAGIVLTREGGTDATLRLGCVSIEGYLARRTVGSHEYEQVDQASIAAGLVGDAGPIADVGAGLGLAVDAPATGTLRDRSYEAADRASVYDRLQELMSVDGGPEWTIDLDWTDDDRNAIAKIFRVRDRVGTAADPPTAVFRTTAQSVFAATSGSEARYSYREDYSSGRGANYVIAYSSGEGEDQPTSTPAVGEAELDGGWPIYERIWQPASNITSQDILDGHAAAELDRLRAGIRTWEISTRWDAYPRYGVDWQLGDDVAWDLKGHRHPNGVTGQGRAIGWALDIQAGRMRLILAEEV